jgi:hypothetical protein
MCRTLFSLYIKGDHFASVIVKTIFTFYHQIKKE